MSNELHSNESRSNETNIIIRHGEPGIHDNLPHGTACKIFRGDKFELYLQINKHEFEDPIWTFVGTFDKDVGEFIIDEEIRFVLGKE